MPNRTIKQEIFSSRDDALSTLAAAFPEAVKDGEVDWKALEAIFKDTPSTGAEKYELTWAGKAEAKREAGRDAVGRTLRFCPEESKDAETTQNLYIEGDNLEVLKLLRENYYGMVKMIYIDPPYNDGDDRIYVDSFTMGQQDSDLADGVIDETGERMTLNPKSSNRFHAKWLSMMFPRLTIARELLRQDGVIFISIDDNEVHNLRVICDSIFGAENFEGHIHWRRRSNQPNDKTKMIGLVAEHILAYARNKNAFKISGVGKVDLTGIFSNPDNDPRGSWATKPWKVGADQSGSRYLITTPTGRILDEEWMGEEATFIALKNDNRIIFPRSGDGMPRKKYFRSEREEEGQCANNWWNYDQFGDNQKANNLLSSLFDGKKNIFSNPKPIELIRGLMQIANVKDNDIILDFFAGSGTTVHAMFEINAEDNSKIRFICVQYPERLDEKKEKHEPAISFCVEHKLPYSIAEITKERIRRSEEHIKGTIVQNGENSLFSAKATTADTSDFGFKVFKVADTIIRWTYDAIHSGEQPELNIMSDKDRLDFMPGFTDIDVVYEIALRQNDIPLSSPVRPVPKAGKRTYIFADSILVCLEESITPELINALADIQPTPNKFVLRDSAFEDDIALKDETLRRLQALVARNTKDAKPTYVVDFI